MNTKTKLFLAFVLKKLREPSTYAALAAIFAATGLITPDQQAQFDVVIPQVVQNASLLVSGIATAIGVALNEGK